MRIAIPLDIVKIILLREYCLQDFAQQFHLYEEFQAREEIPNFKGCGFRRI